MYDRYCVTARSMPFWGVNPELAAIRKVCKC